MPSEFLNFSTMNLLKIFKATYQEVLASEGVQMTTPMSYGVNNYPDSFQAALKIAFHEVVTIFIEDYLSEIDIINDNDYADVQTLISFEANSNQNFLIKADIDLYFEESFQKLKINCGLDLYPFNLDQTRIYAKEYAELEQMLKQIMKDLDRQV